MEKSLQAEGRADASKELVVAIDHGMSFPGMAGLEKPVELLRLLARCPHVDGIIASPGMYRQAERLGIGLGRILKWITVDFVVQEGERLTHRELIVSPKEAADYRPDGFKMFFNVYEEKDELLRNVRDFTRFAHEGRRLGIPCLAEVLFFGNRAFARAENRAEELYKGCRMAMELGADILKIPMLEDLDEMREILDRLHMPAYVLGGSRFETDEAFLGEVDRMNSLPIRGVMLGRNVWQRSDVAGMIERIRKRMDD